MDLFTHKYPGNINAIDITRVSLCCILSDRKRKIKKNCKHIHKIDEKGLESNDDLCAFC